MVQSNGRSTRGTFFPIVEVFGFPHDSAAPAAAKAWSEDEKACPFAGGLCEKEKQYHLGYCSVAYAASWDKGEQKTYAVCDHRLDGPPVNWAVTDYFGTDNVTVVSEVTATIAPKRNIDYVAFSDDPSAPDGTRIIAIETQSIDLRGGGVGPALEAWKKGDTANWRAYFTAEAKHKKRKHDKVDYGVNTGNVYKRLATQVAEKGEYLKQINVPLYVVMQDSILKQLRSRVDFTPVEDDEPWDITFAGFEYTGDLDSEGKLSLSLVESTRTTLSNYIEAFTSSSEGGDLRSDFVAKARKKAPSSQQGLFTI
ncbi:hypothetical protein [Streptomyces sp. NPDC059455]|uniref:hypothetical protein n=1 Tax=Streptomyces sp. NPDC059455 TaxID=3346837 RepID=UPI0036A77F8D